MTNLLTLSFVGRTGEVRLIWGDKEEEERERERGRWMGDGWQICGEVVRILLSKEVAILRCCERTVGKGFERRRECLASWL
jgi:hypothetical protein